jgi:ATP-dependent Clp protease ATP-binding subunit ClpB
VTAVADAVQRSRSGLQDPNRPSPASCSWAPPAWARPSSPRPWPPSCSTASEAMVRIDMSEYMEKHAVARLIGAPPGYVGYEEGGQLTEAVRRRPYAVILFDEMEKAHPDVFNVMLQILDDGRVTDGQGRTVDFTNTIMILTSNIGSQFIQELGGVEHRNEMEEAVMDGPAGQFKPEFLNRVDNVVIFHSLEREHIAKIVRIQLERLNKLLAQGHEALEAQRRGHRAAGQLGYDPVYGARPLKRAIQTNLQDAWP